MKLRTTVKHPLYLSIVFFLVIGIHSHIYAQNKRYDKWLEEKEYGKIAEAIDKSFEKDSVNAEGYFYRSVILINPGYTKFNIDSAYTNINIAIVHLAGTELKEKEKLLKHGFTDSLFQVHKKHIEKVAFERAKEEHTIDRYDYFNEYFANSLHADSAILLRNEIAYNDAVQADTYEAFQNFMFKYPDAIQYEKASENYERLLYYTHTKDKKLESYVRFVKNNPDTPYRDDAEKHIFDIMTADNELSSYMSFIERYPQSKQFDRAINLMYHKYKIQNDPANFKNKFTFLASTDSIVQISLLEHGYLAPIYLDSAYGFINEQGKEVLRPQYESIPAEYICGNLSGDILEVTKDGKKTILNREGFVLYNGDYREAKDLGCGLLRITKGKNVGMLHKSRRWLLDFKYDNIELINDAYIKYVLDDKCGLLSFTELEILPAAYDEIFAEGNFFIIEKDERIAVTTINELKRAADTEPLNLRFLYNDYMLLDQGTLLVFDGDQEAVLDDKLAQSITLGKQNIYELKDGWMIRKDGKYQLYDLIFYPLSERQFDEIQKTGMRIGLKFENKWAIYTQGGKFPTEHVYDSVNFLSDEFILLFKGDTTLIQFDNDTIIDVSDGKNFRLLRPTSIQEAPKDAQYLMYTDAKKRQVVFNIYGTRILQGNYSKIEALGKEYLLVELNNNHGLYHKSGELALKFVYQAIGNYNDGYVSTLLKGKFGIFNYNNSVLLSAKYDKALIPYGEQHFIAVKDAKYAIVDLKNDPVTAFEYEDIKPWNDTLALVKKDDYWNVLNIKTQEMLVEELDEYNVIIENGNEKIARITKDGKVGIMSSTEGMVINPTFNDIINVGADDNPLYFAEKYVQEAEFYIVIYYNKQGKILRKQVFTDQEYKKIYCG